MYSQRATAWSRSQELLRKFFRGRPKMAPLRVFSSDMSAQMTPPPRSRKKKKIVHSCTPSRRCLLLMPAVGNGCGLSGSSHFTLHRLFDRLVVLMMDIVVRERLRPDTRPIAHPSQPPLAHTHAHTTPKLVRPPRGRQGN